MNAPLARRDFFALEAGEYLERLALLVDRGDALERDALVKSARALRGAALMAGPPAYAVAAAAVENVAKALRDGSLLWSPALAESLGGAVEHGKALLRHLSQWGAAEIALCERTAATLNDLLGVRRSGALEASGTPTQSAAVRAYIAREAAALAATLAQAADAVGQAIPGVLDPVNARLQPLRGLGALPGLAPLPELLEALDLLLSWGARREAWPPGTGHAFRATAAALSRLARDIAELGLPPTDAPELVAAADALRNAFATEGDVVPVASLFVDGDPKAIILRGAAPAPPVSAVPLSVELVGLGDRLRHGAAQLRSSPPGPTRALQLFSLALVLRGLTLSPAVNATAGNLLCRLDREAMSSRAATTDSVAAVLDRAAEVLAQAAEQDSVAALGAMLSPLCAELDRLAEPALAAPSAELEAPPVVSIESLASEAGAVPIDSLAPDTPIVSIDSLAPDTPIVPIESLVLDEGPSVAIETLAPVGSAAVRFNALEQTFATYFRLLRHGPAPVPEGATIPEPVDIIVPIDTLLFRGRRALERAELVRRELGLALQTQHELGGVRTLLSELLDLVPLALETER